MGLNIRAWLTSWIDIDPQERLKIFFLAAAFFLVIGSYSIAKELGGSIFMSTVGRSYVPYARLITMIVFIPAIFLYGMIVDRIQRYQVLMLYSFLFGILGIVFAYYIGHPEIGLPNIHTSPYRIFGWLFYFFVEGFAPFVVNVFWAFANSINSPNEAKKNYALIVSGSKLGGILSCGIAWSLFSVNGSGLFKFSDVAMHQIILLIAATMLLCVPLVMMIFMKTIPRKYLHGYEAVYQVEKQLHKSGQQDTGMFSGLVLLFKYPYVLGIFGMIYFYEVLGTVLSFMRLGIAESNASSVSDVSSFLFQSMFITHIIGLGISLVGTGPLLRYFGERICLMLIPLLSGGLLLGLMVHPCVWTLSLAYSGLKAINLAFSWPVRESLYIPTIKEIKFKSKSWIDAFGSKLARAGGAGFNMMVSHLGDAFLVPVHSFFFASAVSIWFVVAFLLGKRFDRAIAKNEVIGYQEEPV